MGNDSAMKDSPCYLSCQVAITEAYPAQHTQLKMANNHHLLMRAMPSSINANDLHCSRWKVTVLLRDISSQVELQLVKDSC